MMKNVNEKLVRYRHDLGFVYPEETDAHMIDPKPVHSIKLDDRYEYYSRSFCFRFLQCLMNCVFIVLVYLANYIRYGLVIKGRKYKYGKYRKYYRKGFITTCNHVFEWDYICVRSAMKFRRGYVTVWKNNNDSSLGKLMRVVGSIPIPTTQSGLLKFSRDVNTMLQNGKWIHYYPEGSMWYYNETIRPFKKGLFALAYQNKIPVYPLAISFRPARGIWRLWKRHGYPCVTIEIGEPIFADYSLSKQEAIEKLRSDVQKKTAMMMEKNTPLISKEEQDRFFQTSRNI